MLIQRTDYMIKVYIGNKLPIIVDNDIIVGKDEYEGTKGLWELIMSKNPDKSIYTSRDEINYAKLMVKTNTLQYHHQLFNENFYE